MMPSLPLRLAWRLLTVLGFTFGASAAVAADALPPVAAADLARLSPADFRDDELDLPYHLAHFHVLANAVEPSGPNRGHIAVSVWRGNSHLYNARVMENILSLAWFYCADRPWNPYRGDPALRARLEAALTFWSGMQHTDGRFSEYGPQAWNLAATAFATKFVGEALLLLHAPSAPPIDSAVLKRADESLARAIAITLTAPDLWQHGGSFTNQFGNVWSGGLSYFAVHDAPELKARWERRFHESAAFFQSPAGYYYEEDGADFGYTLSTHHHNVLHAWPWLRDTPFRDEVIAKEKRWFEWLAYNAVPEPDGSGFVLNRGVESRQKHAGFRSHNSPLGEVIPLVRAFAESREERRARWQTERAALARDWPRVPPLPVGDFWAYSPYAFLHRRHEPWVPSTAERDAARSQLPVLARPSFTRQFVDARKAVAFTFVRHPSYYAAFNAGEKITAQQRYGLGLVWTPQLGAILQTQTASDVAAWGTRAAGAAQVYEAQTIDAPDHPPGIHDLPAERFEAKYPLGTAGVKRLVFDGSGIAVEIDHAGEFTETIPLLRGRDSQWTLTEGRVTLVSAAGEFTVHFDDPATGTLAEVAGTVLDKRLTVLTLRAKDRLRYRLAPSAAVRPPAFQVWDPARLQSAREGLARGSEHPALRQLKADVAAARTAPPLSVVQKSKRGASGNPHDFYSLAPYWWPDPAKPDGLPYVWRDGEVNPDSKTGTDSDPFKVTAGRVEALALGWHLWGDDAAGAQAVRLLETWFLDPATRMTPHLEFAQEIPGLRTGSGIGIISFRNIIVVLDAVRALRTHPEWTPARARAFTAWIREYREWLLRSAHGHLADEQHNNHGTFYDLQVVHLSLFLDDKETARQRLRSSFATRLPAHVADDGSQPHEEKRTRALYYSVVNLSGFTLLARAGQTLGLDGWDRRADEPGRLARAIAYLARFLDPMEPWSKGNIDAFKPAAIAPLLVTAPADLLNPPTRERLSAVEATSPGRWVITGAPPL